MSRKTEIQVDVTIKEQIGNHLVKTDSFKGPAKEFLEYLEDKYSIYRTSFERMSDALMK